MSTLTDAEASPSQSPVAPAPGPESAAAPTFSALAAVSAPAVAPVVVPTPRTEPAPLEGEVAVQVAIPPQTRHRPDPDPTPQQAISPVQRYRNGVGLLAYGTGLAALVLCWAPLTRDLSIILALIGLVLTGLAVLHAHVGIANNTALAAVAGLSCLAALALPGVVTTVLVEPAKAATTGTGTGQVGYATCLARSFTTEQANACH